MKAAPVIASQPWVYNDIVVECSEDGVVIATLARPDRRNAISLEMFDDFLKLQDDITRAPHVRALIVTGAGVGFCAGLDLDVAEKLPSMPASEMLSGQERWASSIAGFRSLRVPVIAAVNGAAAGAGFGLALSADIRVASASARFNAAFVRIGLSAGDVGTSWALPRIVGLGRAYEILLTGRFVLAQEALEIGLVTTVVPDTDVVAEAQRIAGLICRNSPFAMHMTKQVIQTNVDAPSLEAAIELENRTQVLATRTEDMSEALSAFRSGRTPRFTGR